MAKLTTITCPKCDGLGTIAAFGHYAQGVCFGCNGAGTLKVDLEAKKAALTPYCRERCEFILKATEETWDGLSYARLAKARDFAHSYRMAPGAREAYGASVLEAWRATGEAHFMAAQERRLAEWERTRGW